MKGKAYLLLTAIFTVALLLVSCDRNTIYHHYEHTPITGWDKNDTLVFTVSPVAREAVVKRDVEVRMNSRYPFRSLCLIVEQTVYPLYKVQCDTLNCTFTDDKGNNLGKGLTLYEFRFPLPDISINKGDSITVSIHHDMKREILSGIADIGVRLTAYY